MDKSLKDEVLERSIIVLFMRNENHRKNLVLPVDAFTEVMNRTAWQLIMKLYSDGRAIDALSLRTAMIHHFSSADTNQYISELLTIETPIYNEAYKTRLLELMRKRWLLDAAKDVQKMIANGNAMDDVDSFIMNNMAKAIDVQTERGVIRVGNVELTSNEQFIKTGVDGVDNTIMGLFPGQLIIIAARTRLGKSSLALQMAKYMSARTRVLFASIEMGPREILYRILASETGVPVLAIRSGLMTSEQRMEVAAAYKNAREFYNDLFISSSAKIDSILMEARQYLSGGGVLFVDYLQLGITEEREMRHLQVADMTRKLKNLAMDMKIPVVALSQLNRNADGEAPQLRDLRESGSIEQDADVVIFIHKKEPRELKAQLIIAKSRDSGTAIIDTIHQMNRYNFLTLDPGEKIPLLQEEGNGAVEFDSIGREAGPSTLF